MKQKILILSTVLMFLAPMSFKAQDASDFKPNNVQQWAIDQLANYDKLPPSHNLMLYKDGDHDKNATTLIDVVQTPDWMKDFVDGMGLATAEQAQSAKDYMNRTMRFYKDVIRAIESLPENYLSNYDKTNTLTRNYWAIRGQVCCYYCLQREISEQMGLRFIELNVKKNAQGKPIDKLLCPGFPCVQKDPSDNKYKFYEYEKSPVHLDEKDMKKAQQFLSWLTNASILLDRPDDESNLELYRYMTSLSKNYTEINNELELDRYNKLELAIQMLTEAIKNN